MSNSSCFSMGLLHFINSLYLQGSALSASKCFIHSKILLSLLCGKVEKFQFKINSSKKYFKISLKTNKKKTLLRLFETEWIVGALWHLRLLFHSWLKAKFIPFHHHMHCHLICFNDSVNSNLWPESNVTSLTKQTKPKTPNGHIRKVIKQYMLEGKHVNVVEGKMEKQNSLGITSSWLT